MPEEKKTKHPKARGSNDHLRGELPVYDTMSQCAAATGIPLSVLQACKEMGFPAFQSNRVYLFGFLVDYFKKAHPDAITNWLEESRKMDAELKQVKLDTLKKKLLPTHEVDAFHAEIFTILFEDMRNTFVSEMPPLNEGLEAKDQSVKNADAVARIRRRFEERMKQWHEEGERNVE